jgi:hypothetical protein
MLQLFRNILRNLEALSKKGEGHTMSKEMRERFRSPSVNVDGTPMAGMTSAAGAMAQVAGTDPPNTDLGIA